MDNRHHIASAGISADISTLGAELLRLRDEAGRDLLWNGDPAVWAGRAPILFPIVGQLAGGTYRLDGATYAMPKRGFARRSTFTLIEQSATAITLGLSDSAATHNIYPFAFDLRLRFAASQACLTMSATVANEGDSNMPFSFGFHPALRWPLPFGGTRADHRIAFEQAESEPILRIDSTGLIRPERIATPIDGRILVLRDELFVEDAVILAAPRSRRLDYGAGSGRTLSIGWSDLPTLAFWTKPGADYLCIEPWRGMADPIGFDGDIRDKPGIVRLPPGESARFTMTIAVVDPS